MLDNGDGDGSTAQRADRAAPLIVACAAKPRDHVTIAGCRHLDLLIDFLRHGFAEAGCQADRGPHDGHRPSDVLIVPSVASDLELLHVVARLGCDLRSGGVLVVRDDRPRSDGERRQLLRILAERGFAPIPRVGSRAGNRAESWLAAGGILCARKIVGSAALRAA
jgi:hypothetical protein